MTAVPAPSSELSPALNSRAVVTLTGLSYLCVALSFSYLDRNYGVFKGESVFWCLWTALGFGAGVVHARKSLPAGDRQWKIVGILAGVLCVFPAFFQYNFLRWLAVSLLLVVGARAAVLRTRRDFHFTLTAIFVVSFMVGTHGRADWTLWFYIGPAWVLGGLALAWEHALGTTLTRWIKVPMTLGFILLSFLLSVALFFFAPRPPTLGFGFLPPGTDTQGMFKLPSGLGGSTSEGNLPSGSGKEHGGRHGGASGAAQSNDLLDQWAAMLGDMRRALSDKNIPDWQRGLMRSLLDGAQSSLDGLSDLAAAKPDGDVVAVGLILVPLTWKDILGLAMDLLLLLALLVVVYLFWRSRFRIAISFLMFSAWVAAFRWPVSSMRMSALAVKWCLQMHGHKRAAGQSVREHWNSAVTLAPLASRWLGYAVEVYCAMRFGGLSVTRRDAINMRKAVQGAHDIMMGIAPELKH